VALLYSDENFPFPTVVILRTAGHDVLTALADGRAGLGIPDPDVLTRATALGRAILTHNRKEYFRLHATVCTHAGIVACKEDLDYPALAARIHATVSALPSLAGQLVRVNRPNPPTGP
jgi:Domain of unknown function (DUF5615)